MDNTITWKSYNDTSVVVSDSVVKSVVEKLLNSEQSGEMLDIVLNYLRGYLEKIMDNPEIIKQGSDDKINNLIDRRVFGDFNIIQRLTNIEQSIVDIHRAIMGYSSNWNSVCSPQYINLPVCIKQELDDLRMSVDMLQSELYKLKAQNP